MLVFLDESGDAGMKLDKGSSPLFVVALVIFEDHNEAQACDDAISEVRRDLFLPDDFEFHFTHNKDMHREAFLEAVRGFAFDTHVFALNKARTWPAAFQVKESLYKWTARTTIENAKPYLDDAHVVLDRCGDQRFRNELTAYLKRHTNPKNGPRLIKSVRVKRSRGNNLLQLADYVASASARSLNVAPGDKGQRFRRYVRKHERSFRLWPPGE